MITTRRLRASPRARGFAAGLAGITLLALPGLVRAVENESVVYRGLNEDAFMRRWLANELQARPSVAANEAVSTAVYDAYVGRYDYGIGIMSVTKDQDRLFAQLSGQPRFEIFRVRRRSSSGKWSRPK